MTSRKSNVDPAIGRRIRTKRKAIGMSQIELATFLGISFQQIQKYESGVTAIAERRLSQICKALGLPLSFFMNNETYIGRSGAADGASRPIEAASSTADPSSSASLSQDVARLGEAFVSISDARLRLRILEFVLAVAADQTGGAFGGN